MIAVVKGAKVPEKLTSDECTTLIIAVCEKPLNHIHRNDFMHTKLSKRS